jgi:hypothetical protein
MLSKALSLDPLKRGKSNALHYIFILPRLRLPPLKGDNVTSTPPTYQFVFSLSSPLRCHCIDGGKIVGWMKRSASTECFDNGGTAMLVPPYNTGFPPEFTLAKAGAGMTA